MKDASFLSSSLKLRANSQDDLEIISTLLQDSLGKVSEIAWLPENGILAFSLCRFTWEDKEHPKRHLCGIDFSDVTHFRAKNITPNQPDQSFSILSIHYSKPNFITITCAEDIQFQLIVNKINLYFQDLDKIWDTKYIPNHPL